jgi:hypothetical protein
MSVDVSIEEDLFYKDYTDAAEVLRCAFANMVSDHLKGTDDGS